MAIPKKSIANKQNSKKSSGPKTQQGKAQSSANACKHGVLSRRLFLEDESPAEYQLLLDGLQASLSPVGTLELMLVEKIAICYWRQQRLIRAETAGVELNRCLDVNSIRLEIEEAMGITYPHKLSDHDLTPPNEDDDYSYEDACKLITEYSLYICPNIKAISVDHLEKMTPIFYEELELDAEDHASISEFLASFKGGLCKWIENTYERHCRNFVDVKRRRDIAKVAALVKSQHSAPVNHELISKYQTTLNNELYRAIRALREAQEWRLQSIANQV
ncbi:hypothetical protein NH8B_1051 [Pseudogulbenkiania sp. NH8B]|uniref:hypothetical protein n=1 Tax=Pseudogulbenkiania sp. (strain NH8B) TaxID=748280 RepID=UPI0002279B8E|nr:hypothetical protein [Pseudogulbenkiania sp. NH8B]BAK75883.1 hypothetical protein NH8B_1051 [Pseudogulbenkiania sp. NH8B]